MSYSNIKRVLSVALFCAFAVPSSQAVITSCNSYATDKSTALIGDVVLTDNNNIITLSLRDSDVKQVLRMFADKAGMNIVFHSSVEGKVTLDLVQTPINQAFNLVLQVAGLNYYKQGNTMIVMAKDSPDNASYSKQDMMVFPIKYVGAAKIADFLNKNVFGMKKPGLSSVDAATVNSATNELIVFGMPSDAAIVQKVIDRFDREPLSKTFAVNHTTPAEMANMICNYLLPSRGVNGSGNTFGSQGSPADVVTGGAASVSGSGSSSGSSEIKLGEGTVACTVSSSTSGSVAPFDIQNLSVAYFPQRGTITLMGGSESQIAMIERFVKANDVKQPQAILEVSIVELNEDGSREFSNNWTMNFGSFKFTANGADGTVIDANARNENSKFNVTWNMNYLIENGKAKVLANPKIMITNGQESTIDLTQDYIEKVTSEYLNSSGGGTGAMGVAQKTYSIGEDLGIKVSLTPFISPDGYVTLNIKPDYTTVAGQETTPGALDDQGKHTTDIVATLLKRRNLDLKNVRIKDGETLFIAGLIQESDQKTVKKIPLLGDLPGIGAAFRSTVTTRSKSELVIMLTPKIIHDGEGAVADSL